MARSLRGWTQAELGERVGDSKTQVGLLEGGRPVSEAKLERYATAMGLELPFLRYGVRSNDGAAVASLSEYNRGLRDGVERARDEIAALLKRLPASQAHAYQPVPGPRSRVAETATRLSIAIAQEAPETDVKRLREELDKEIEQGLAPSKPDKRAVSLVKELLVPLLIGESLPVSAKEIKKRRPSG